MKFNSATLATLVSLCACGTPHGTSTLKITNGKVIAESERPEVVNLYRRLYENGQRKGAATCTGTWIGPTTILTAAHCTGETPTAEGGQVPGVDIVVFEITDHTTSPKKTKLISNVVKAYRNRLWDDQKGSNPYDLAILETEEPKAGERPRGRAVLSHTPAQVGDAVTIVGYGFNNMSPFGKSGDDHKRTGSNTIASISDGMLNITGAAQDDANGPTGERASAGDGDSGGPMFKDEQLIGVASAGGTSGLFGEGAASYIDLQSEASKTFLATFGF